MRQQIKLNRSSGVATRVLSTCVVDERVGSVVLRNRGFREARGAILFSIDDDAYYAACDTISKAVHQLEADPQLFALALPFIETRSARAM